MPSTFYDPSNDTFYSRRVFTSRVVLAAITGMSVMILSAHVAVGLDQASPWTAIVLLAGAAAVAYSSWQIRHPQWVPLSRQYIVRLQIEHPTFGRLLADVDVAAPNTDAIPKHIPKTECWRDLNGHTVVLNTATTYPAEMNIVATRDPKGCDYMNTRTDMEKTIYNGHET